MTPLKPMALCASAGDGGAATASTRATSTEALFKMDSAHHTKLASCHTCRCAWLHVFCPCETCCPRVDHCFARACCGRDRESLAIWLVACSNDALIWRIEAISRTPRRSQTTEGKLARSSAALCDGMAASIAARSTTLTIVT